MKYIVLLLLCASTSAFAGDYYEPRIDTYDPATGLYFKAVESSPTATGILSSKTSRGFPVNINIFDPKTGQSTLLFEEPQAEGISIVLFETEIKNRELQFNGSHYSGMIMNNTRIEKRPLRDRLLVGVRNKESSEILFYVSDKRGNGLKKWLSVPAGADWHMDAKNLKLRVVQQVGGNVRIESYEW